MEQGVVRDRRIDEVEADVGEVCGHLNALHGRLVELVATVLDEGLWRQPGVRSPEHWATWQLGVSATTAKRLVAAAHRRDELPVTMAALNAGELSLDQVSPIVETAPSWADGRVAAIARYATVTQIRRIVRGYPHPVRPATSTRDESTDPIGVDPFRVDPDGEAGPERPTGHVAPDGVEPDGSTAPPTPADAEPDDAEAGPSSAAVLPPSEPLLEPAAEHDAHGAIDPHRAEGIDVAGLDVSDPERLTLVQRADGSWQLWGRLDADHGLLLDAALREIADRAFAETGQRPSRAAALVELAHRHHSGLDPDRRSRYRVSYLIDETRQLCDPYGNTLPEWLRDLISCDADVSITWQRHGTPIAHTNSSTNISVETRRHVLRRDHGRCRICGGPGRHLHHIRHREHGGPDHPGNIALVCEHCHRLHHRGVIQIRGNPDLDPGDPDGLHVTDPRTGRRLRPNSLVRPPTGPPPPPSSTYRHPTGERLDTRWIDFESPPPSAATPVAA